jgi:diketogulonate reductase-like aldo/keto reductase
VAKSVTPERIKANIEIISLDDEDMMQINAYSEELQREGKLMRFIYPPFGVDFGFSDNS